MSKNIQAEIELVGDLSDVLSGLLEKVEEKDNTAWLKEIDGFKDTGHKIDRKGIPSRKIY